MKFLKNKRKTTNSSSPSINKDNVLIIASDMKKLYEISQLIESSTDYELSEVIPLDNGDFSILAYIPMEKRA